MSMLEIEIVTQDHLFLPDHPTFERWVSHVLMHEQRQGSISLRIVDEAEIQALNADYRHKDQPTNVLAFPSELPKEIEPDFIGDIVLCAAVVHREAHEQHKNLLDHFAHLTIHATLHLLGYDHVTEEQAVEMEALEIRLLADFNISNPY